MRKNPINNQWSIINDTFPKGDPEEMSRELDAWNLKSGGQDITQTGQRR